MQSKADSHFRTVERHPGAPVRNAAPLGRVAPFSQAVRFSEAPMLSRALGGLSALALMSFLLSMPASAQQIPNSGGEATQPALAGDEQAEQDGIIWSQRASKEGLLVGVKLDPPDGRVRADETLGLQFILRNDSPEPQHVRCLAGTKHFLNVEVHDGNYLFPGGFVSRPGYDEIHLRPGEVYEGANHRVEFSTQGLLDGEYTWGALGAFNVSTKVSATRAIGYVSGVVMTVGDGRANISPPPERTPSMQIYWGEVRGGLALGTQLVRLDDSGLHSSYRQRSGRFTVDDELELQLHVVNVSDQTQVIDIKLPSQMLWPVTIQSENRRTWQRRSRVGNGERVRLSLPPGEQRPLTGVEVPFLRANAEEDSTSTQRFVPNASIRIGDSASDGRQATEFHPSFGQHEIMTRLTVRPTLSTLKIELQSGRVPFRVVPPLPESQ